MINFLKCEGKAIIKLVLELSYQERNKITHKVIEVSNDNVYRITVADGIAGIKTISGRIVSFTICPEREVLSYVNKNTKPSVVDTITLDCSESGISSINIINVCDIRTVEELSEYGFEDISQKRDVPTFK